jgi:outer membrane protein OmpA-like peptidoglycan-associated protein
VKVATAPTAEGSKGTDHAPEPAREAKSTSETVPAPKPKEPLAAPAPDAYIVPSTPAPAASAGTAHPKPPRFDTAALPPGNIATDAICVGDVQGAANRVQVHFARGDARLDTPGKALIDGLVTSLNACPGASLNISGHADASGKARHNKALSERRARSVAAYMVDKGIDARRLVAVGYGDKKPVAPNDTRANRAKNRRIDLAIAVRSAPTPPMPVRKQGTRNGLSHR